MLGGESKTVEVIFSPTVALYIKEREWHPGQKLTDLPDGGVRFRARLAGCEEFLGWVLSWGKHARLVRPRGWREVMAEHAMVLCGEYGRVQTTNSPTGRGTTR